MSRVEIVEMLKFRYSEKAIKNWKKCPDSFLNLPAKIIGDTWVALNISIGQIIATYFLTFIISQDKISLSRKNKTEQKTEEIATQTTGAYKAATCSCTLPNKKI